MFSNATPHASLQCQVSGNTVAGSRKLDRNRAQKGIRERNDEAEDAKAPAGVTHVHGGDLDLCCGSGEVRLRPQVAIAGQEHSNR